MTSRFRHFRIVLMLTSVFIIGLTGGVMLDRHVTTAYAAPPSADAQPNTDLLLEAWRLIDRHYVDREAVEADRLTYGAITGLVDALGDTGHSSFLSPQLLKQHKRYTAGQFEGIGAQVERRGDYVIITAPMDDSPALAAGLKAGDIILKVDGEDMTGATAEHVISKIIGPAGTQVNLVIIGAQDETHRELTLTRAVIKTNEVTWAPIPGTTLALLRIPGFSQETGDKLKTALAELKAQNRTGIILDLRNNPGGLLEESVTTASQFLHDGNVLLTKNARGETEAIKVEPDGLATEPLMAVLINYGTASAAEIVAGALQDAGRARVIGETTYGTGTVLNTFPMSDGSAMLLATGEWLTPNGRVIWHQGLKPDEKVSLPAGGFPLTTGMLKSMEESAFRANRDLQLLRAVELLTCHAGACQPNATAPPGGN
jgi:carboxyl-terminal processing protease